MSAPVLFEKAPVHPGARWTVVEGDCRHVLAQLDAGTVDHVITDPPYSEHVHAKQRRILRGPHAAPGGRTVCEAPLGFDALDDATREDVARELGRLRPRWALVFSDAESVGRWGDALEGAGMEHVRVGAWVKLAPLPQLSGDRPGAGFEAVEIAHRPGPKGWNGGGLPAIWVHAIATDRNKTGERVHPAQKPLGLMMELVEQFTQPGDLVLDPFCGSGTTGVACLRMGRRFIGIERDPHFAAVARERLEAEARGHTLAAARTGQLALLDL